MLDRLTHDVRIAFRSLKKSPGFAIIAIVTLALGIGANTAVFSVVNGVLLRDLPYDGADRMVIISHRLTEGNTERAGVSGPDFAFYQENAGVFEDLIVTFATSTNLYGDGDAEGAILSWVTPNFFPAVGAGTAAGRMITAEDKIAINPNVFRGDGGAPPALRGVISHGLWQRRYGGEPSVVGRTIGINGQTMEIIGVVEPGFEVLLPPAAGIPTNIDVWTLFPFEFGQMPLAPAGIFAVLGKLKPGVSIEQARAQMDALAQRRREESQPHANLGFGINVDSMHGQIVGPVRPLLLVLLGAVGFVFLIASANVANLLLVRASAREREIAIRTALGSGRSVIIRQMLTESLILSILGAVAGLGLAHVGVRTLLALQPGNLPRSGEVGIDGAVLAFTLGASVLAAVLFGLAPVFQSSKAELSRVLTERSNTVSLKKQRIRGALIVGEVAVSVVLLIGAGLMLRSFSELSRVQPGFKTDNVLTFRFALPVFAYRDPESMIRFFEQVSDGLAELPGVEASGGVSTLPLARARAWVGGYARERNGENEWERSEADYRSIQAGYFEAMQVPLLRGRYLEANDNAEGSEPVIVIDRRLAEAHWPGDDPVGQYLQVFGQTSDAGAPLRIVGVVEHVRYQDLRADGSPTIYFPRRVLGNELMDFTLRTSGSTAALIPEIRRVVRGIDPNVPILAIRDMNEYVADALAPTRFALMLLAVFSGVALVMAAVGLYGVISYSIRQRNHEIGVRIALGAERGRIMRLVVGQGLRYTSVGVLLGVLGAIVLNGALQSMLFGVTGTDPMTYGGIAVLLVTVAAVASYVPARRATKVDPIVALRSE